MLRKRSLVPRLGGDSGRTLWAVADQCAVSGGNFLTNLILLRTLLPVDFGTYALILNAMFFLNTLQQAFVGYSVCVRGARANNRQFRHILAFGLITTLFLWLTLSGPALSLVGASLHRPAVILAAVFAILFWQLQDTLRAGFIAKLEQSRAFIGDALSYGGQAVLLAILCVRTTPNLSVVFWVIAFTSLLALAVQSFQIRPKVPARRILRPLVKEFWFLGRWNVVARVVGFLTLQAFPWLILMRHGRVEVAGYQALFQFLAFTNPLLFSIGSLILSTVAKDRGYQTRAVRNYLLLAVTSIGSYLSLLVFAGPLVMRLLYGSHSHYLAYAPLLPLFAMAWSLEVIATLATSILGGLSEPRALFVVQLSGAATAVILALPVVYWKGLRAAGFCILVVNAARAGTGLLLLLRHARGNGLLGAARRRRPAPLRSNPFAANLATRLEEEYAERG